MRQIICYLVCFNLLTVLWGAEKAPKQHPVSELDRYLASLDPSSAEPFTPSPGSLWTPHARLLEIGSDIRASRAGDLVTVVVQERASATSKGSTKTQRTSSAKASVASIAGMSPPALGALAKTSSDLSLNGEGVTSRENTLQTTLAAQVSRVLPNGSLLIESSRQVTVNSEVQTVTLRGIIRPVDISNGNLIRSDRIALLEVKVNGKGVVNDVVRRPNFLYRLLLGILPF